MITTAVIEAIDRTSDQKARANAREFLGKFGYGSKVDITSKGERITEVPKIISVINARPGDRAPTETQTS
ncbi:hypothetical protein E3O25_05475 [Cryobacterium sp. TMT1-3]|nr:hypothetical protein E3O25_05475 [Cryobacterium sp. TMT1-3]